MSISNKWFNWDTLKAGSLSKKEFDAFLYLALKTKDPEVRMKIIRKLEEGKRDYYAESRTQKNKKTTQSDS